MFKPLKPETVARLERERKESAIERKRSLRTRLQEKASAAGPGSIWAEMLQEFDASNP